MHLKRMFVVFMNRDFSELALANRKISEAIDVQHILGSTWKSIYFVI